MAQKHLLLSVTFLLFCLIANAQQRLIALEHNGTSSFFNDIPAAVSAAVSGDIIYLPGGSFPGFGIDKKLTIIGAGHDPESTSATSMTLISGGINMNNADCDGTILSGLRINGDINSNTFENDNVIISRCSVYGLILMNGGGNPSESWAISECMIKRMYTLINSTVSNCLIVDYIVAVNSQIENNIFLTDTYHPINANSCTVKNNIFYVANFDLSNCLFYNNIWKYGNLPNGQFGNGNSSMGASNIYDPNFDGLFTNLSYTNYAGNQNNLYLFDFHLVNPAYNTGGTDGLPIGIYGGPFPWKEGSIPSNPHILTKSISPTTDPVTGNLNINIQVEAQDH